MDSLQVSLPITPAKQAGAVDDLYEAVWELLAETIRKNAKHKSAGKVLDEYLPDTREDGRGASTSKALCFVFKSPAGACDVQMAVAAHWFELAAALAAKELAEICNANGFELSARKLTALGMAKAVRELPFVPRGDEIVGVVRGDEPAISIDCEGEMSFDEAELTPAAKKLARAANTSGACACPFCEKVRAGKAVAAKPKKERATKPTKPGVLPKLEHFTSMAKAVKSPDRVGSIEVPDKGHTPNDIPADIGKLSRMTSLVVNGWGTVFPPSLFDLRQLEVLVASVPRTDIPDAIGQLTGLRRLVLNGACVPDAIGRLTELTSLSLRSSGTAIPASLTSLTKLVRLELLGLGALEQPLPDLGMLAALQTLIVSATPVSFGANANRLRLESVKFSSLRSLVRLEIERAASFPVALRDMPALCELKLVHVDGDWPEIFDTLPALTNLKSERAALTAWPRTLNDLPKLREVELYESKLESLEALRSLPALEGLSIRGGPLTRWPEAPPHLPALERLRIEGTKQLSRLPEWIADLPSLRGVSVSRTAVPQAEIDALKAKRPTLNVSS